MITPPGLPAGIGAAFLTRDGGVSEGPYRGRNLSASTGDEPARVRENRRAICRELGIDARRVCMVRQVHGRGVVVADAPVRPGLFTGDLSGWPEGDALVSHTSGVPLLVLAADCVPVLLWRTDGSAVGAVHAGWRGLVSGVIGAAAAAIAGPLEAAIGPAVGACHYPVDVDLRRRFAAAFGEAVVVGDALDLACAARICLLRAGVAAEAISVSRRCTACEPDVFYSHRRDGAPGGRHGAVVWRRPGP